MGSARRRAGFVAVAAAVIALVSATTDAGAQDDVPTCAGLEATIVAEPGVPTVGTSGPDVIVGTGRSDEIRGGDGDDVICARGGHDLVSGGDGDDLIIGGAGRDDLQGRRGADTIQGNRGRDEIDGGRGADTLSGGGGQDRVVGGRGADRIDGGRGPDVCDGGPGDDTEDRCEPTVSLAFSGEILSHGAVIRQAAADATGNREHDYRPMFAEVRPLLRSADLAICHLETPVSETNTGLAGYPVFNAPRELPWALERVGYDGCSTASNHSMDRGAAGVRSTLRVMDEAGLAQTGMARSQRERDRPTLYEIGDLTIGHVSYTYGLNGFRLPADQPYLVNVTGVEAAIDDAEAAKAAGADLVVLSIQWGNEYQVNPSSTQVAQAHRFLRSDAIDLIIGAHVHVVQPVDVINGKYVFYGVGNFLSNQSAACCPAASQNGIIAHVEVVGDAETGWIISNAAFTPTRVDRSDYTIVPLPQALDGQLSSSTRSLYRRVVSETTDVVQRLGIDIEIHELS